MTTTLPETHNSLDLVAIIQAEYREMPGLRLTLEQATRLWNVDRNTCREALESLVRRGILYRSGSFYVRTCCDR